MPRDAVLQGEFDLFGEDDGHGALLQDAQGATGSETVGGELFALVGVDFFAHGDEADFFAGADEGEGEAGFVFGVHGLTTGRAG